MKELFVSYVYKLRHDLAFRITLFIGIGFALLMSLIYWGIGKMLSDGEDIKIISGQLMLFTSLSPSQNFGIAIPVNLITFTVMEFNHGSIRNKIVCGHSKGQVYTSLFLNGLIFAFTLLTVYVALCFGLGCALGGFEPNGMVSMSFEGTRNYFLGKILLVTLFSYVSIVSFTIFFTTLFRNIGPAIPVVLVGIMVCYLGGTLISMIGESNDTIVWVARCVDPLYAIGASEYVTEIVGVVETPQGPVADTHTYQIMTNETLITSIVCNIVYAIIFFVGGLFIFKKRDIK